MSHIKVLSSDISNKIAAGEVVERPASVIKELMENAIDAGATALTVEIKNGGISYIRVTDNGSGMDQEDAQLAFLRHATSKIQEADDLEQIHTLGFRGEALASIAAVSRVELMTKTADQDGVLVVMEHGQLVQQQGVGCPTGTTIIVRQLFANVPARMKFLKKNTTETGYITDIVERLALACPHIGIKYIVDGKEKLFTSGDGKLQSCIYNIYGSDYARKALPVERQADGVAISGFVGTQELSRGNRSFQSFFVNGRYVKNRALTFAAENAFRNHLMVGKFPFFVLSIQLPVAGVDINVHPTKQEVKFAAERTVTECVYWAVKDALSKQADIIRDELIQAKTTPATGDFQYPITVEKPTYTQQTFAATPPPDSYQPRRGGYLSEPVDPFPVFTQPEPPQASGYKIMGQLFETYIVVELENKIVLIDQHAAHERLLYEKLLVVHQNKQQLSQVLLSPAVVTLSPQEYSKWEEQMDFLEELGFVTEEFGNNSILVRQAPPDLQQEEIKHLILELIDQPKGKKIDGKQYEALHMIACKAAVKGNSQLKQWEIDALIDELLSTGGINTCPHGRPIMIALTRYELEKMFKRIQ